MEWRFRVLQQLMVDLGLDKTKYLSVLDVGAGTGVVAAMIERTTQWRVDGVELNPRALECAYRGRGRMFLYDIREKRSEMVGRYDVVLLLDVLEHVEESVLFLEAAVAHLNPGGRLVINVPALPKLYGRYDRAVGHLRRYSRSDLISEAKQAGLQVECVRYWGLSLIPLLVARNSWLRWHSSTDSHPTHIVHRGFHAPWWLGKLLKLTMQVETLLLSSPPVGTSIIMAGVRSSNPLKIESSPVDKWHHKASALFDSMYHSV